MMLGGIVKKEKNHLESEIDRIHTRMLEVDPDTEEYSALFNTFERLLKLQDESRVGNKINPNTLLVVGGNVLCVLVVVGYEHGHVLASKALQFLTRPQ